jgi:hypothetical protein
MMFALGQSQPSHFAPASNNVRYTSDSDHSRHETELTLSARSRHERPSAWCPFIIEKKTLVGAG